MRYELVEGGQWNLQPGTLAEEVLQNVRMIMLTVKGEVWMYRDFGLDVSIIDKPVNAVQSKFIVALTRAVSRYEPRAKIRRVWWERSEVTDGRLSPRVEVEIEE